MLMNFEAAGSPHVEFNGRQTHICPSDVSSNAHSRLQGVTTSLPQVGTEERLMRTTAHVQYTPFTIPKRIVAVHASKLWSYICPHITKVVVTDEIRDSDV